MKKSVNGRETLKHKLLVFENAVKVIKGMKGGIKNKDGETRD